MDEDYEFIDLSYFYKKMLEILENIKIPDMEEELAEYISSQTAQRPQPRPQSYLPKPRQRQQASHRPGSHSTTFYFIPNQNYNTRPRVNARPRISSNQHSSAPRYNFYRPNALMPYGLPNPQFVRPSSHNRPNYRYNNFETGIEQLGKLDNGTQIIILEEVPQHQTPTKEELEKTIANVAGELFRMLLADLPVQQTVDMEVHSYIDPLIFESLQKSFEDQENEDLLENMISLEEFLTKAGRPERQETRAPRRKALNDFSDLKLSIKKYKELKSNLDLLKKSLNDGIKAIDSAVVANRVSSKYKNEKGIGIYFPKKRVHKSYMFNKFARKFGWLNFIVSLINA